MHFPLKKKPIEKWIKLIMLNELNKLTSLLSIQTKQFHPTFRLNWFLTRTRAGKLFNSTTVKLEHLLERYYSIMEVKKHS